MSARVLIVKNIEREGPGLLRDVLQTHHVGADVVELNRGDRIPALHEYGAMIVLGGPASANDETEGMHHLRNEVAAAIDSGLPYLGICLGMQVAVKAMGGQVVPADESEVGFHTSGGVPYSVDLTPAGRRDPLLDGLPSRFRVFQLHGETVERTDSMELLAASSTCREQIVRVARRAYGLQMHVELVPEMLAVWMAQDPQLANGGGPALQRQLSAMFDEYAAVGRRLFTNFLAIADLISAADLVASVDLTRTSVDSRTT